MCGGDVRKYKAFIEGVRKWILEDVQGSEEGGCEVCSVQCGGGVRKRRRGCVVRSVEEAYGADLKDVHRALEGAVKVKKGVLKEI